MKRTKLTTSLQREPRGRIEPLDELSGFLHQSFISPKNVARLKTLSGHEDLVVAEHATLILQISDLLPHKKNRWLKLARHHRSLLERAIEVFGTDFFEDLLTGYGDFESPLWDILGSKQQGMQRGCQEPPS